MSGAVDVVVAGAGPAGVAAALEAARRGLEVALLDRARFPRDKPCGEGLLPAAVGALDRLGLLALVRPSALPIEGIGFSVPGGPAARARFCDAAGGPAYGLGIPRRVLDALLIGAARRHPAITVLEGVEVRDVVRSGGAVTGVLSSAGEISARCVIAADGLRSPLRAQLGLERPSGGAHRVGLRVHFSVPRALPFGRSVHVVVAPGSLEYYVTPVGVTEIQVAVLGTHRAFFAAEVGAPTVVDHLLHDSPLAEALAGAVAIDKPLGAGPFRQRVRALVTDGVVLAGDAAGYFDAITGEGIGLALETGTAAGTAVAEAIARAPSGPVPAAALAPYVSAHRAIVRDAERLTRFVLVLARHPRIARHAIGSLSRSPALFRRLLQVQAGAPLSTVNWRDWARLLAV